MVEQNAGTAEHPISLPVLLHDPEPVLLRHGVGRIGVKGRLLPLGHYLHLSVQLRGGSLVDPAAFLQPADPHRLQHPEHSQRIHIRRILRHIEGHLHMALGRQIVDLIRAYLPDQFDEAQRISQIPVLQMKIFLSLQMHDPLSVIHRGTPYHTVHLISLLQQKFRQIRTVLSCHACDQRPLSHTILSLPNQLHFFETLYFFIIRFIIEIIVHNLHYIDF